MASSMGVQLSDMDIVLTDLTLIDNDENKEYNIRVSPEDAERAQNGKNFFL